MTITIIMKIAMVMIMSFKNHNENIIDNNANHKNR
jgi:hypothetical protein